MLSTDENPLVDLSCSSSSSQLIKGCTTSNVCSDEKNSDENDQKLQFKLDPFKSSSALDENKKPLSNFSIRDYVFCTRDKDIKTHWPFSSKNLQLCLKHGVSNVLPPFQTPHFVRNNSILHSKAQESPSSNKVVRNTRINPIKNCKSAVKLPGNINSELPKPSKDHSMKTTMVTDHTMVSKVCPVCKTFSSSSNTKLNAHIDQCLSEGPTSNLMTNTKVIIKHRIKPRKIRLMVDIYTTALSCTLEDLDRRNGTNWASNSNPAKDLKGSTSVPPTDNEEKNETSKDVEGAVYVDSTGTKLRILSKFSDLPSVANSVDDSSLKKVAKGDKGYKFLSSKKKKYLLQNHKHLKSSSHEKILDHCPKTKDHEPKNVSSKECVKKHDQGQPLEMRDRMISDDFGIVKKWVGSKRTLSKKKKNIPEHQRHRIQKTTMKNLRIKNRLLSSRNDHELIGKGTSDSSSPPLSDKITSLSAESRKKKENLSIYSHDGHTKQHCLGKRTKQHTRGKKSHLSLSKSKASQKDSSLEHDHYKEILHGPRDSVSSNGDKHIWAHVSPLVKHDDCSRRSIMPQNQSYSNETEDFVPQKNPSLDHKKFSSSMKNLPSHIKHFSVSESKNNVEIKHVGLKKRKLRYSSESDEEPIVLRTTICRRTDDTVETLDEDVSQREQIYEMPSNDRFKEFKVQTSCFKNSLGSISHCIGKNTDDSYLGNDVETCTSNTLDAIKEVEGTDFMAFNKYLDSELPSYAESVPQHFVKEADELPVGVQENGAFPMDNCDHLVIPNTPAVIEIDANEDQANYYANIDPIPIPGPPGSFLPSPGCVGSDELQGSSSLTSCRMVHSSEDDDRELVDLDSSDSPVSATSVVSNSIVDGSDSLSVIDLSKHRSDVQVETQFRDASIYRAAEFSRIVEHNESMDKTISSEYSPCGLIRNSEPCCCSRKEGALRSDFLNHQESRQVLRQQTMNYSQMDGNMMYKLNSFNSRSEVLNVEDQPTSEPDKVITDSSMVSHNRYESPSPNSPNPVLRLMGKNLMVVNKEENFLPKLRPTQDVVNEHLGSRSFSDNGRSDKNMQNVQCSYSTIPNQGPSMLGNGQTTITAVEFGAPNGFRMHGGFKKPELFPQKSFNGICTPSLEYHGYEGGFGPTRDHLTSNVSMNRSNLCENEKMQTHHLEVNPMPLSSIDALKNPFHVYKTHNHPLCNATLTVQSAYGREPYSVELQGQNLEEWVISAENPRILRTNSFTALSSLPGLTRSSSQYISAMKAFPERRL